MSTRLHPVLYLALVSVDNTVQIPLTRPMLALCGEGVSSPRGLHEKCEHATPTPIVVESSNRYFSSLSLKIPFQWTPFLFPSPFIFKGNAFIVCNFSSFDYFFQEIQSCVPIKKKF